MAGQTDQQIMEAISSAVTTAMQLMEEEEDWTVVKEQDGAVVKTKKNKDGQKVWLCTATVNVAAKVLWDKLLDTDDLTSWNTTLTTSKVLKTLAPDMKVTYQVTSEGGGGVVSARDFVYGCKTEESGRCKFVWLMDCDYRGMIPTSFIEIAMPSAQLQMIDCINKLGSS